VVATIALDRAFWSALKPAVPVNARLIASASTIDLQPLPLAVTACAVMVALLLQFSTHRRGRLKANLTEAETQAARLLSSIPSVPT
jgi:hypothetical protein